MRFPHSCFAMPPVSFYVVCLVVPWAVCAVGALTPQETLDRLHEGIRFLQKEHDYTRAEGIFRSVLDAGDAKYMADANHLLGVTHHYRGPYARSRAKDDPSVPLPDAPTLAHHTAAAEQYVRRAIEIEPRNYNFYNTLAEIFRLASPNTQYALAAEAYTQAVELLAPGWLARTEEEDRRGEGVPESALEIGTHLGSMRHSLAQFQEAMRVLGKVVQLCPLEACTDAHFNLALLLRDHGGDEEKVRSLRIMEALRDRQGPTFNPYRHLHVAIGVHVMMRLAEAVDKYQEILQFMETHPEDPRLTAYVRTTTLVNCGAALQESGDFVEANALYRRAIALNGADGRAYNNLGASLWQIGDAQGAVDAYKKSIELEPTAAEAYVNLGVAYYEYGDAEKAIQSYTEALRYKRSDGLLIRIATMALPIMQSEESVQASRRRFQTDVTTLLEEHLSGHRPLYLEEPVKDIERVHFYNVYHGENERATQSLMARLYLESGKHVLQYVAPSLRTFSAAQLRQQPLRPLHLEPWRASFKRSRAMDDAEKAGKILVAFCSKFLVVNHAHGQLLEGIIRSLDPGKFYVVAMLIPNPQNQVLSSIASSAAEVITLPFALINVRGIVGALVLDILVFADMMSEPLSYFMGLGTRLAPVQCLFWGNPVTSGSPDNIDYFVTGEWMEPEGNSGAHDDGDGQYTEQAVRLRGQGIHYEPIPVPPPGSPFETVSAIYFSWQAQGAGPAVTYMCAQSLFKLHPSFDIIFDRILSRVPHARLVLLQGRRETWTAMVQERMAKNMSPGTFDRVHHAPRVGSSDDYLRLLRMADVVLHPFPFGGSKTSADAIALGLPLVIKPTDKLRARMAYSFFVTMGVFDTVAWSDSEYVDIAVRLGLDPTWRAEVAAKVKARSHRIWEHGVQVADAWSRFFERAHRLARGEAGTVDTYQGELPKPPRRQRTVVRPVDPPVSTNTPAPAHVPVMPPRDLETWVVEAQRAFRRGDVVSSEKLFRRALQVVPNDAGLHNDFASVLKHARRLKEAEHHYRVALQLFPNYTTAMSNLGVVLHEMNDWAGAKEMYARVLALEPGSPSAMYNMGNVYRDTGDPRGGALFYRKELGLDYTGGTVALLCSLLDPRTLSEQSMRGLEDFLRSQHLFDPSRRLVDEVRRLTQTYTDAANNLAKLGLEASMLPEFSFTADGVPNTWSQLEHMSPAHVAPGTVGAVHIVFQYYVSADGRRQRELDHVLVSHLKNPHVERVHVLVQEPLDLRAVFHGLPVEWSEKVDVVHTDGQRLTFALAFQYANTRLQGKVVALCNADIAFDETLVFAMGVPQKTVFALLRWEPAGGSAGYSLDFPGLVNADHRKWELRPRIDQQDAWIFTAPLDVRPSAFAFFLGQPRCDNRLAAELVEQGITVLNPAISIRALHHQRDPRRAYTNDDHVPGAIAMVRVSLLQTN